VIVRVLAIIPTEGDDFTGKGTAIVDGDDADQSNDDRFGLVDGIDGAELFADDDGLSVDFLSSFLQPISFPAPAVGARGDRKILGETTNSAGY